jgi:GNAT superfamily N-acetyltransferase
MKRATTADVSLLVDLMAEFYGEAAYELDRRHAAAAFTALLDDPALGRVWILESDGQIGGYIVLTLGYSMEYGGRDAFVDDLFVRAPFRNRGLGTAAIETARAECEQLGVRAIHLEVGHDNDPALAVYRKAGFRNNDRELMTLRLASPSHLE